MKLNKNAYFFLFCSNWFQYKIIYRIAFNVWYIYQTPLLGQDMTQGQFFLTEFKFENKRMIIEINNIKITGFQMVINMSIAVRALSHTYTDIAFSRRDIATEVDKLVNQFQKPSI